VAELDTDTTAPAPHHQNGIIADIGDLALGDIVDAAAIRSLMEDFHALTDIPTALIDLKGKVLIGVGWQQICTRFHRVHPQTCKYCIESDTQLSAGVAAGEFKLYRCKNNMWDVATPLIVGGRHLGNVFSGQFFFDHEPVDYELFRAQARQYGFDERAYIGAVDLVPRVSRATVGRAMDFLRKFGQLISQLSYSNLQLARAVVERDSLTASLQTAAAQLHESEARLRVAALAAKIGIWSWRPGTGDVVVDANWRTLFGVAPDAPVTFETWREALHPDDRERAVADLNTAAEAHREFNTEYRVIRPDGTIRWIADRGLASYDSAGRPVSMAGVNVDISERRQTEQRLQETQKRETIGMLAAGVAHDFNNILTVIMGSASAALSERPGCEHAQAIISASQRAAELTKQLLAYAGKGFIDPKPIDVTALVAELQELLRASVPKRVRLNFELAERLPWIEADRSQIEQILINLVINAGEAISPQQADGVITVATSRYEMAPQASVPEPVEAGTYVCLEVADNGCGMDEATRARIFDPFFTTKFAGRGLGLAAVQGIVRTWKGAVEVRSVPGAGTTFRTLLPALKTSREADRVRLAPDQHPGCATVLVVDDEVMIRRLAGMTLRRRGYEVFEARDGKEALELLANCSSLPALVLLDLTMPVMGAEELVPILQARFPGLKIILSSGYLEEDTRNRFPLASIAGFLQKPYTGEALAEKVGQALKPRTEIS
jgi:PAS domain S-box-containing protein